MVRGMLVVEGRSIISLKDKLSHMEYIPTKEFSTLFCPAREYGYKQIIKHGKKIEANIFVVEDEYFFSELTHRISGTFYKLID